jgi:hypothetical protein
MLTCVAFARSAPTVQFSRPSAAKGSNENSRMAFKWVILLSGCSAMNVLWGGLLPGER